MYQRSLLVGFEYFALEVLWLGLAVIDARSACRLPKPRLKSLPQYKLAGEEPAQVNEQDLYVQASV